MDIKYFKQENAQKIFDASMQILERTGMEFPDEEILELLRKNNIKVEGKRAFFTKEQILEHINKAPKEFTVYARNPKYDVHINNSTRYYTPGYGCPKIKEFDGKVRNAKLKDHLNFLELIQVSEWFNINGGILAQPSDVDLDLSYQIMTYANVVKSDKCVITMPGTPKVFSEIMDILSITFGGKDKLKEKPRSLAWINTLSPLSIDKEAIESIKLCCEYNQCIVVTTGSLAGATAPITTAGVVAMNNAECLSTLAVIQMLNPGTPVVYGLLSIPMDMKTSASSCGTPQYSHIGAYGAMLSDIIELPSRHIGTQVDANGVTAQAGYEAMFNLSTAINTGSNLIMQAGGVLDAFATMSYEKLILDFEIISFLEYYHNDIEVNDKTLALDVIDEVVKSGNKFMSHKHTAKNCRKVPWKYNIAQIGKVNLSDTPNNILEKELNKELERMYSMYERPEMDENTLKELKDYMIKIGTSEEVIESI